MRPQRGFGIIEDNQKDKRKTDRSFCREQDCGSWALGLIRGDRRFSYDRIDLAYDVDRVDEFLAWIKHARYEGKLSRA